MEFYRHEYINKHVIRIIDFLDNCCYLVVGNDYACILDNLDGFGDIEKYIRKFTDLPIICLLSHGHIDHASSTALFENVHMNHKDLDLFKLHTSLDFRISMYGSDDVISNLRIKDLVPQYTGEIKNINDGDTFDLGGITIKMILVPGHTFGMMVPIIVEDRIAIFGDACGVGTLLFGDESPSVKEYKNSLLHLKKYEQEYDTILRNHGTFESPKELLDNVILCCDKVISGKYEFDKVESHGNVFSVVEPIDEHGNRRDGKQGNLKFIA